MCRPRTEESQDAFDVGSRHLLLFFGLVRTHEGIKEAGGWQLLAIANNHNLLAACDCAQSINGFYLACFVENDQVKIERSGRQVVGNGKRAHHEDGLDGLDGMPSFEHESADRKESPLLFEFAPEHANLTCTATSR